MSVRIKDVVVGGVYATVECRQRRVTRIVRGRVYYELRQGRGEPGWVAAEMLGHGVPTVRAFALACVQLIERPGAGPARATRGGDAPVA